MLGLLKILIFSGIVTVFSSNDKYNPNPNLACTHKKIKDNELLAAHRNLPCGTKLVLINPRNNNRTEVIVLDRGPYGKFEDGTYKAVLDISLAAKEKLKHNGKENLIIIIKRLGWGKKQPLNS